MINIKTEKLNILIILLLFIIFLKTCTISTSKINKQLQKLKAKK